MALDFFEIYCYNTEWNYMNLIESKGDLNEKNYQHQ